MFNILEEVEKKLPILLQQEEMWKSVFVDYHLPFVKRLWTTFSFEEQDYRIYLHQILPCELEECLFHPHPWPSIMKILSGKYKMTVGYGQGMNPPETAMTLILPAGTTYEMTNPDGWHAVCPIEDSSFSLMITGKPWERPSHKSTKTLLPLQENEKNHILSSFIQYYK